MHSVSLSDTNRTPACEAAGTIFRVYIRKRNGLLSFRINFSCLPFQLIPERYTLRFGITLLPQLIFSDISCNNPTTYVQSN